MSFLLLSPFHQRAIVTLHTTSAVTHGTEWQWRSQGQSRSWTSSCTKALQPHSREDTPQQTHPKHPCRVSGCISTAHNYPAEAASPVRCSRYLLPWLPAYSHSLLWLLVPNILQRCLIRWGTKTDWGASPAAPALPEHFAFSISCLLFRWLAARRGCIALHLLQLSHQFSM